MTCPNIPGYPQLRGGQNSVIKGGQFWVVISNHQGPDELTLISRYAEQLPYLVLDDIGVEKMTDWARQTLDVIFYERDGHNLATIITSNLSPDEIEKKIDARISSRIAGMGKILPLIGPDYRITSRKKGGG